MNTSNPFQVPVCFQRDYQQRRRERFKKGFIASVAALVALLVGLLIEGCMSEQSANSAATPKASAQLPLPQPNQSVAALAKPDLAPAAPASATPVAKAAITPAPARTESFYVVKSGDTLTRIARTHGTTVKALKAANHLDNDRIVVGAKLKLPEA